MAHDIRSLIPTMIIVFVLFGWFTGSSAAPEVFGYRAEGSGGFELDNSGQAVVYANQDVLVRLFGRGLTEEISVSYTPSNASRGSDCDDLRTTDTYKVQEADAAQTSATVIVNLPLFQPDEEFFLFCLKTAEDGASWVHQGGDPWTAVFSMQEPERSYLLPLWIQILLIFVLLAFSGLFSGLNLGLMSLDKTELRILENCGSDKEKKYAKAISPLRKRGNFLLCTILLGNVLVNNTLTILLDDLTGSGAAAVIGATASIVIFGEIIPQAVCSRYGLAIGAKTIWFTKIFMVLTFPLSFPISIVLDKILGEEMGNIYNRVRLRELLLLTSEKTDLRHEEVNIITGALDMSKKTAKDIMTKLDDVYMLKVSAELNFETMNDIMKTGYTRVPVYEGDKTNVIHILNIKDLALIDPDDKTPLRTVCEFYDHPINFVFEDNKLTEMLEEFKKGKSHMSFVRCVNNEGPGDPYYETLGVVTLEDVIEEIIQSEIIDETDTVTDNRRRAPRPAQARDFSIFKSPDESTYPRLSPQLSLATFQYLSTTVEPFKPPHVSPNVLQRLIQMNVLVQLRPADPSSKECLIYERGEKVDYFVLLLEGRAQVEVGKDNLQFETGPFTYFGTHALTGPGNLQSHRSESSLSSSSELYTRPIQFIPDFTLRALGNVQYLKITRSQYVVALRTTQLEQKPRVSESSGGKMVQDHFTEEWRRATSHDPDLHGEGDAGTPRHSANNVAGAIVADGEISADKGRADTLRSLEEDGDHVVGCPDGSGRVVEGGEDAGTAVLQLPDGEREGEGERPPTPASGESIDVDLQLEETPLMANCSGGLGNSEHAGASC